MAATVVHCLGALLVANEARRDFELTIIDYEPESREEFVGILTSRLRHLD